MSRKGTDWPLAPAHRMFFNHHLFNQKSVEFCWHMRTCGLTNSLFPVLVVGFPSLSAASLLWRIVCRLPKSPLLRAFERSLWSLKWSLHCPLHRSLLPPQPVTWTWKRNTYLFRKPREQRKTTYSMEVFDVFRLDRNIYSLWKPMEIITCLARSISSPETEADALACPGLALGPGRECWQSQEKHYKKTTHYKNTLIIKFIERTSFKKPWDINGYLWTANAESRSCKATFRIVRMPHVVFKDGLDSVDLAKLSLRFSAQHCTSTR